MQRKLKDEMREISVTERSDVPPLSVIFGYGPMLPIVAGGVAVWLVAGPPRLLVIQLTVVWSSTILAFLAGVRRGLSFRTSGGPRVAQIATMLCLFLLAFAAFMLILNALASAAASCDLIGYAAIFALDPIAARQGEAPAFFARLRPPQMLFALAGLIALIADLIFRG